MGRPPSVMDNRKLCRTEDPSRRSHAKIQKLQRQDVPGACICCHDTRSSPAKRNNSFFGPAELNQTMAF